MKRWLFILFSSFVTNHLFSKIIPEIEDLGLWCVYVETVDGEEPTCDVLKHPVGCSGESITNANKVACRILVSNGGGGILFDSGSYDKDRSGATIRVRGNTSASQFEKKPYKIKLQKKADLLCRNNDDKYKDKDWLLIKNWGIHGLIGFKMNELLKLPYAPQFRYVNVVLNGAYKGTYLLCESVKRNSDSRVNISKSGFLFEYDAYWWKEDVYVKSNYARSMHYTFKYPDAEDLTPEKLDSFSIYINKVEESLKTDDYSRYLNLETFVKWVIGQDILGNYDAAGSNIYLSKYDNNDNSKLSMSCLWDFDGIMGNQEQLPQTFARVHDFFFYQDLFSKMDFVLMYVNKYEEISSRIYLEIKRIINDFKDSDYGHAYERSFEKDRKMWGFYKRLNSDKSFQEWVNISLEWLDNREMALENAVAALKTATSIHHMLIGHSHKGKYIYDLNGRKLAAPHRGINIIEGKKIVVN